MRSILLSIAFLLTSIISFSQDTIQFANGDKIVGEVKSLDKGVITIETDYSDSDFQIEWKGVERIHTSTIFLITLSDGQRLTGSIASGDSTAVTLKTDEGNVLVDPNKIVYLKSLDQGFWSQIYANVDVGFSLTKANNLQQLNTTAGVGYLGENWAWDARFKWLNSTQDSVADVARREGSVGVNRFLPNDWFLMGATDFLSNTEQLLDLRFNGRLGLGYYLVHKNTWYWSFTGGGAYVTEDYSSGEDSKDSWEAFIGMEMNLFDMGDLSLFTKVTAYPGITEAGRFRTDFNMDAKYDLPMDFYIKGGFTFNYDNQPAVGASELDYVFTTGFGWEW